MTTIQAIPVLGRSALAMLMLATGAAAATVDIRSYGAVADDGIDDAAAIRAALAAAAIGDTVAIPAGRFVIGGTIAVKGGIRLIGAGQAASRLAWTGSSGDILTIAGDQVEMSGITIDGAGRTAACGIFAYGSHGHALHHLTIQAIAGDGALGIRFTGDAPSAANGVTDSTIADCTIRDIGVASAWGGGIRMSWGSSRNRVLRNVVDGTGRGGIFGNDDCTDLVVAGNTVTRSGLASTRLGIELWGRCHRGLIEDNHIDHWLSLDTSDHCAVRRNTVADAAGWGFIGLEIIAQDVVVCDNLVDGGQDLGISISGHAPNRHVLFEFNTIRAVRQFGAQLYAEGDGISRLYFYKNRILDTQISTLYTGRGFLFNSGGAISTHVVFEANEISGNRDNGLDFLSAANGITGFGNTITGNAGAGVTGNPGADVDWHDNAVSGNGHDGQPVSRGYADRAPVAAFTCPATALVGQTVTFADASSDPDGTVAHRLWDLGAGVARSDASPTHAYQAAGSYRVTLIAWDDRGRAARAERTIVVGVSPPPPSDGTVWLSDLAWASVANGWGPAEKDRSNGEIAAGDGLPLTLAGTVYAKGLGVHALSEIRCPLDGRYARLLTDIGVDDEAGANGSVAFQVWVDGVKRYGSKTMRGSSATKSLTFNLSGARELRLVVTGGGDGIGWDHADWAGARLLLAGSTAATGAAEPDTATEDGDGDPADAGGDQHRGCGLGSGAALLSLALGATAASRRRRAAGRRQA
jgi:PKD repeat protein